MYGGTTGGIKMKVRRNTKKDRAEFEVIVELNVGEFFFTERAARELRDRLSSVLAELKRETMEK